MDYADFLRLNPDLVRNTFHSNLLNMIPGGVSIAVNAECDRLIHNPVAAKFFGIEPWRDYAYSSTIQVYEKGRLLTKDEMPISQAIRERKEVIGRELEFVFEDGSSKSARISACPLLDEKGEICGGISILEDITDIRHLTRELLKIESRQAFLISLSDEISKLADPKEVLAVASRLLGNYLKADLVYYDTGAGDGSGEGGSAAVAAPLMKDGKTVCTLNVISRTPRNWTADEIALIQEVGRRTWDIAERVRAEEALGFQAKLLAEVHDAIVAVDENRRISYWNKMSDQLFGWTAQETIGRPLEEILDKIAPHIGSTEELSDILESEHYEGEVPLTRKDGTRIYTDIRAARLKNKQGELKGMVASFRDITARVQREEELKATQEDLTTEVNSLFKLHTLSAHVISGGNLKQICKEILQTAIELSHAAKGNIQLYKGQNRTYIAQVGFQEAFLRYFSNAKFKHKSGAQTIFLNNRVIIDNIEQSPFFTWNDLKVLRNEGICCCQFTPMLSSAGNFVGVLATYYQEPHSFSDRELRMIDLLAHQAADIIEITRILEALRLSERHAFSLIEDLKKADRNKNQFLSSLSHELRNPLASIMMSLSLLKLAEPDSRQAQQALETLDRQTVQLSRLVDDLLEVTRINQNRIELKKQSLELNRLVAKTAEDFQPMLREKEGTLKVRLYPEPIYLNADPARLIQVVGNLLHNAVKFTEQGCVIEVRVSKDLQTGEALVEVEDNGLGVQPDLIPELFQPFIQGDKSLDRQSGGLGLGLTIVKNIVELHGGTVTAYSEGLGKGARFTIRLPCATEEESPPESRKGEASSLQSPLKVLVIDDIPDIAQILCTIFERLGHQVVSAASGTEGLKKAKEFRPDLIICDIGLPGMNGYDVARNLRQDPAFQDVCLIALSGYAQPEDKDLALAAGFDRHLAKPVSLETLKNLLEEFFPQSKE